MTDKEEIIIDRANILKEKINMCFILLSNRLETTETIERTIYEHLVAFVDEWNDLFQRKEQECERLKKQLFSFMNGDYCANGCSLKQQLDQLKSENETYEKMFEDKDVRIALTDVKTGEREVWRKLGNKAQRYEKALNEIEQHCNEQNLKYDTIACEILNIISKAKDGKNE